ncbi:hypothetical protein J6590_058100 [Homalodisca vitripennis]|nr:hypothetical protein J6590_058100 [Homalodisca vitripennis]
MLALNDNSMLAFCITSPPNMTPRAPNHPPYRESGVRTCDNISHRRNTSLRVGDKWGTTTQSDNMTNGAIGERRSARQWPTLSEGENIYPE